MTQPGWVVGVDVGGTFTDVVAVDPESGARRVGKTLTTPEEPTAGVLAALELVGLADGPDRGIEYLAHGTTLAINALIQRAGADAALVTTRGFRDVIETAREDRHDAYDLQIDVHAPLVRRRHRWVVDERTDWTGAVLREPAADELDALIDALRETGRTAVAICFLHSYANPANERLVAERIRSELPDLYVTASSDVAPTIREYERFVATAVNAYVGPVTTAYLERLDRIVRDAGGRKVAIMKSNGGLCGVAEASTAPVTILESGPVAGVVSASETARECEVGAAIAFDMGGTTAKASLLQGGGPMLTDELEVARLARLKPGSGLPIRLPSVDLMEIGAGGGSIARINELGLLQVGPDSAGSVPGPACYGLGGTQPTVTDANLLLGYLNPAYFAGGQMALDVDAARAALDGAIAPHIEADEAAAAAWAVHDLVNEGMAHAIRQHCVEHGVDPREVVVIATGGAGPVHVSGIVGKLGCLGALCPVDAGVGSAFGLLAAPESRERSVTDIVRLDRIGPEEIRARLSAIERDLRSGVEGGDQGEVDAVLHMRVARQGYEVRVAVDYDGLDRVGEAFRDAYARRFGSPPYGSEVEIVTWDVRVTLPRAWSLPPRTPAAAAASGHPAVRRPAYFGAGGWTDADVYARAELAVGASVEGPAAIEESGSTAIVAPGQVARVDRHGNLHIVAGRS